MCFDSQKLKKYLLFEIYIVLDTYRKFLIFSWEIFDVGKVMSESRGWTPLFRRETAKLRAVFRRGVFHRRLVFDRFRGRHARFREKSFRASETSLKHSQRMCVCAYVCVNKGLRRNRSLLDRALPRPRRAYPLSSSQ